ncbi:thioredoxin domain-containing protein [Melioribacter sp. OK-6-Me]|uniref:thioredoxin domain-containing protein n=1 Tax=unclassified Melioribacter TaxID=2627329 RepID=UPI003ED92125
MWSFFFRKEEKINRLKNEKSPYLRQHADNPVNWYAWCDEAFRIAQREDKPVFLSIGYSTCHWCHVMAHESFEDEEVAELLNKHFISIKVDREERPDIDSIYMTACQLITGRGGWPLSIFLTPDRKPFYAGTYFPKYSYYGRIGFVDLLNRIIDLWNKDRSLLLRTSDEISSTIIKHFESSTSEAFDNSIIDKAFETLKLNFDAEYGGFGTAPKFPAPHNLLFLLDYNNRQANEMVEKTLTEMRKGGIYDQIGFGFHRYSTDKKWFLPHFEKMIYDQASLIEVYALAYAKTGDSFYADTVKEVYEFIKNEMTSSEGAFYSALDADSEGEEGKYYLWTSDEIKSLLGNDYGIAREIFNFSEEGNHRNESTGNPTRKNIFFLQQRSDILRVQYGRDKIESIRKILLEARSKRIKPLRDEKILTDWNSMVISSLALAGSILENKEMIASAEKAFAYLIDHAFVNNQLYHYSENKIPGFLDDYAYLIKAALELYKTTLNEDYLFRALQINDILTDLFEDKSEGGFFYNRPEENTIRLKFAYDGAIPSGNSIQLLNLIELYFITGNNRELAVNSIKAFSSSLNKSSIGYTYFLRGIMKFHSKDTSLLLISGNKPEQKFISQLRKNSNLYYLHVDKNNIEKMIERAPWLENYKLDSQKTIYYLCKDFSCTLPTDNREEILLAINQKK